MVTELPTAASPTDRGKWDFTWTCPRCEFAHHDRSAEPLETFRPDPEADIVPPGTMPNWCEWRIPERIVFAAIRIAEAYAEPVDSASLEGCESLLDHDGQRRTAWGTFVGERSDPTALRLWLARLRHAPRQVLGATLARVVVERVVLATGAVCEQVGLHHQRFAWRAQHALTSKAAYDRLLSVPAIVPADADAVLCVFVAPVIGHGRLTILNRYEDWLWQNGAHPWFASRAQSPRRARILPELTDLADIVELADEILTWMALRESEDTLLDVITDATRLQLLMALWRRLLAGLWERQDLGPRAQVKTPNAFWLTRWEQRLNRFA